MDDYIIRQMLPPTLVLTPNQSMAATVHKQYQRYQLQTNVQCFNTPDIIPITAWLKRLFNDFVKASLKSSPLLLNDLQESVLWEEIIKQQKEVQDLLQLTKTAELARSAYRRIKEWQIDLNHPLFSTTLEYRAFKIFAERFNQIKSAHHWIDYASLAEFILQKLKSAEITVRHPIHLLGFAELTPEQQNLFAWIKERGITLLNTPLPQKNSHTQTVPFAQLSLGDQEMEITTMARYAKALYANDKKSTIGCIIPALNNTYNRVNQIFTEVFAYPQTDTAPHQVLPFNVSALIPFANNPIIHTALEILQLANQPIDCDLLSNFLRSPYLGEAVHEKNHRASFDLAIRATHIASLSLADLTQQNTIPTLNLANTCPLLATRVNAYLTAINDQAKCESFSAWTKFFNKLLHIMGWPGEFTLSTAQYQILEQWLNQWYDLNSLDQVSGRVTYEDALQRLRQISANNYIQVPTQEAAIQILSTLESVAIPFDHLWICGMDDLSFPKPFKPHPFIPRTLQKELNMPHASAQWEHHYCQELMQQLATHGKQVIFSYAKKNQELDLHKSPLLRHIPEITLDRLPLAEYVTTWERIYQSHTWEWYIDAQAPAINSKEPVLGGINIIKEQALCPFRAFAKWRLFAEPLENLVLGLRASDRGTLTHKAIELLWDKIKDHATLIQLNAAQSQLLIKQSIAQALDSFALLKLTLKAQTQGYRHIQLEAKRLNKLLDIWLQLEKTRPPFKLISNEKNIEITLGPLTLMLRVDRIDELTDGKKIIIDYKTGKNQNIHYCFGERPDEPQLPVYCLLDKENTIGVLFAQLTTLDFGFKGVSKYPINIKGVKPLTELTKKDANDWESQLHYWDQTLTQLSQDFHQGIATVDPKDPSKTCLWCGLKPLCRIHEEIKNHDRT